MTSRTVVIAHPGAEMYGSDRVLLDSAAGLVTHGFTVVVILPEGGPLGDALGREGATVRIAPSLVLRKSLTRPSGWPRLVRDGWLGAAAAWKIISQERPEAIYVNTITLPLWPLVGRLRGIPVILHVHEAESSASRLIRHALYGPALAADRIVINSSFSLGVMAGTYARLAARTRLLLNAVPGPPSPTPPRESLDGPLRICFIGRLSPRKGVDLVLDAARILVAQGRDVRVDLAGSVFPGYEWYEHELLESAGREDLEGRVTFHGFQSDVWAVLQGADVIVVPSRLDEPFGNTAVEAVLARRPVVVSATSGLIEATAGVPTVAHVEPGSAAAIADAIDRIADGWDAVTSDIERAARIAQERHSVSNYRRSVVQMIDELIAAC